MDERKLTAKRRIMFLTGEDYYYLTYTLLLLLDSLDAKDEARAFYDHRKLAFLGDLISNGYLTQSLIQSEESSRAAADSDSAMLSTIYSRGLSRLPSFQRLIHALTQKQLIRTTPSQEFGAWDIWLNTPAIPTDYINSDVFRTERKNIGLLRKLFPQIRKMQLEPMFERLFRERGVMAWRI